MKLRKCLSHPAPLYTLKELCPVCNNPTSSAHYKYIKLPSVKETTQKINLSSA